MAEPALDPNTDPTPADPPADPPKGNDPSDPPKDPPADPPKGNDPPKQPDPNADPLATEPGPNDPPASFPENWRDLMSNGDEKLAKQLQNFTSPDMVAKAFADLRKKISSGDYKQQLPDDATEEEIAQWRKDNGVPEKPDGYKLELPQGFELEDDDQAVFQSFAEAAHKANMPNDVVNAAMGWYASWQEEQRTAQATADAEHQETAIQELRSVWPQGEYKANLNAGRELLQSVGDEFADWLLHARGPDGMAVGNHPGFRQFLAQIAQERNPSATLLPSGQNNLQGISSRLDEIRQYMRTDRRAYNKDAAVQQEFQRLLEAEQSLKARQG